MPLEEVLTSDSHFIDVSWDSDAPLLEKATEELFSITTFKTPKVRTDAVTNLKKHMRGVLIFVTRAYQADPLMPIACPRNNSFGTPSYTGKFDPFNPLGYNFKKIREVMDGLIALGFLESHIGRQDYFNGQYQGRASRVIPTQSFHRFITTYGLHEVSFKKVVLNGGLILTRKDERKKVRRYVYDYSDIELPPHMARSKEILTRYNTLIENSDIRLLMQHSDRRMDFSNHQSRRIFNKERYDLGGRFYGGWWTYCGKIDRKFISINNEQTVECDFKSNHLYLFYGLRGAEMPEEYRDDPYNIDPDLPREVIKILITRLFNFSGHYAICNHIRSTLRDDFPEEEVDESDISLMREHLNTSAKCREIMNKVYTAHPILMQALDANDGLKLMNWDSRIAEYILDTMTTMNIPVLCIHDSFIVQRSKKEELKKVMNDAFDVLGIPSARSPIKETYSHIVMVQGKAMAYEKWLKIPTAIRPEIDEKN